MSRAKFACHFAHPDLAPFPPQLRCDIDVVIRFESSLFDKPESALEFVNSRVVLNRKEECFARPVLLFREAKIGGEKTGRISAQRGTCFPCFSTAIFAIPSY